MIDLSAFLLTESPGIVRGFFCASASPLRADIVTDPSARPFRANRRHYKIEHAIPGLSTRIKIVADCVASIAKVTIKFVSVEKGANKVQPLIAKFNFHAEIT